MLLWVAVLPTGQTNFGACKDKLTYPTLESGLPRRRRLSLPDGTMPGIGEQQSTRSHKIRTNRNKKSKSDVQGSNLGRSIIRQQFAPTMSADDRQLLETERGKHQLRSVTQCDDLEELMSNAMLAGTDFTAKRGEVVVLGQEVHASAVHLLRMSRRTPRSSSSVIARSSTGGTRP